MLKTLDNYIEPAAVAFLAGRDRRFARILAISILWHVVFIGVIIRLNIWSKWEIEKRGGSGTEIVMLTEIAPPSEKKPLRAMAERTDKADLSRLQFDPQNNDDVNLTARSPRLGSPDGSSRQGASKPESAKSAQPSASSGAAAKPGPVVLPQAVAISQPVLPQTAAVASLPAQNVSAPAASAPQPVAQEAGRAERQGTGELSMQEIEGQYLAYVRARIHQANERILPREWVKDVLNRKVSADFEILIARGGRLLSARLTKSSGYSTLDDTARQAIYNAKPFEGYPSTAGDTLALTVTVYYAPWR